MIAVGTLDIGYRISYFNDFWDDRLITNSYITQQLKFEQDDKSEMLKNTYSSQIYFSICFIQYVIYNH